ncbi:LuxR family transcriptional regulator [Nocardioides gilvus]|uniref:LuxR family transcriptional regulator n=1 Tax=Nocardioides gilvus TaxID=1735589 RepID=UPI001EF6D4F0|nr:LuxR family transcriptional regulator [Nocardioides gilvus]
MTVALYGPQDRELFERVGASLYEAVIAANGISLDDPLLTGDEGRRAFDLLLHMGLLVVEDQRVVAADPSAVASLVVAPMGQQGAQLLAESAQWAQAFTGIGQAWRNAPGAISGLWTELHGEAINPFIASVVADAEFELLTAQPQAGRSAAALGIAAQRDIAALDRGVKMRTLYQHSARRSRITHRYVAAVSARGAEVRTLDEFFNRLIVVDRRVAVIPGHEGLHVALAVREPSMVAYLVDMFERTWEHGRPFANQGSTVTRDIAAEQRAMTIRMLVAGHADPVSAKRLGVSPRTYAAYVADLKAEFDAQTRFQLGYEMGRRGVSGEEQPGHRGGGAGVE